VHREEDEDRRDDGDDGVNGDDGFLEHIDFAGMGSWAAPAATTQIEETQLWERGCVLTCQLCFAGTNLAKVAGLGLPTCSEGKTRRRVSA